MLTYFTDSVIELGDGLFSTRKNHSDRRVRMERPPAGRSSWRTQAPRPNGHGAQNPHHIIPITKLPKQKILRRRSKNRRRNHHRNAARR